MTFDVNSFAEVAELAYAYDSKSYGATPLVGSNPTLGTRILSLGGGCFLLPSQELHFVFCLNILLTPLGESPMLEVRELRRFPT